MLKYPITITIDTNIFDSARYSLTNESPLIFLKKHVKEGRIRVVLSDIVLREVKAHLTKSAEEFVEMITKRNVDILKKILIKKETWDEVGVTSYLDSPNKEDVVNKLNDIFEKYIQDLDVEIMETTTLNMGDIINDYFSFTAPFENNNEKRKEFPDAIVASQIRSRFPDKNSVVIISNDNGFIEACNKNEKYISYNSLGKLFDSINEQNDSYNKTLEILKECTDKINKAIKREIFVNKDITVSGLSHDANGRVYGNDYYETKLRSISDISHNIYIIDDIDGDEAIVTLAVHADIDMDCYYNSLNYEKQYFDKMHKLEKHHSNFACRIRINIKNREFELLPMHIHLGVDSRKEVIEIVDNYDDYEDYEYDLLNEERDEYGFQRLDKYDDFVIEKMSESDMNQDIIEVLGEYQSELYNLEDVYESCEDFIVKLGKSEEEQKETLINKLENNLSDLKFEYIVLPNSFEEEEVLSWLQNIQEKVDICDKVDIPDELELEKEYSITGIGDRLYITIEGLSTKQLSEGDQEQIEIKALTDKGKKSSGEIELTVGYLNFDDNGGAADGLSDDISFEYSDIIDTVEEFVSDQKKIINEYKILKDKINDSL